MFHIQKYIFVYIMSGGTVLFLSVLSRTPWKHEKVTGDVGDRGKGHTAVTDVFFLTSTIKEAVEKMKNFWSIYVSSLLLIMAELDLIGCTAAQKTKNSSHVNFLAELISKPS